MAANDPILGQSVIAQSVAPSCRITNVASDEQGRLITVAATSSPSGSFALSSSTMLIGTVALTTYSVVGLTTPSIVGLTTTSIVSLATQTLYPSTGATYPVALSSGTVTLSSAPQTVCTTPTLSSVSVTTTAQVALSINTSRAFATANNEGPGSVCVAYGTAVSMTAYTVSLTSGSYWELPPPPIFTGAISIISATSGGVPTCRFCEVT